MAEYTHAALNRNFSIGPPIQAFSERTYRLTEKKARNAEEALLAAPNACGRRGRRRSDLRRRPTLAVQIKCSTACTPMATFFWSPSVAKYCFSRLDLSGQYLPSQDLEEADLHTADLRAANEPGHPRRGRPGEADLRHALLGEADPSHAHRRRRLTGRSFFGPI